jgi:hypothetical protein
MARGMPKTLWRSTLVELWRLVALTASVSVTVIAFGAAIKPMADGKLEAVDALKFIALAMLPMLAYALPFAAGFSATLVYHRMAQDNEMTAAQAGGISLRLLLVPALLTGMALGGVLTALNEQAIPRFLRRMQQLVSVDVGKLLDIEIGRGRSVTIPGTSVQLLADLSLKSRPDPGTGATDLVRLSRPFLVEIEKGTGEVSSIASASRADLWFFPGAGDEEKGRGVLHARLRGAMSMTPKQGASQWRFDDSAEADLAVPNLFGDNPKFLTSGELRRLRTTPERIDKVDAARRALALDLAQQAGLEEIRGSLEAKGVFVFEDENSRRVTLRAGGLSRENKGWTLRPAKGAEEVEVDMPADPSGEARRLILGAKSATLRADAGEGSRVLRVSLALQRVRTRAAGTDAGGERAQVAVGGLTIPSRPDDAALALGSAALLDRAAGVSDAGVGEKAGVLRASIWRLGNEVTAKQHERAALAASCFVMVLTGAVTAVRLSRSQPLTVYLWTFFPALACLVTISGGQQTVRSGAMWGLGVLWAGVLMLLVYTLLVYRSLARH